MLQHSRIIPQVIHLVYRLIFLICTKKYAVELTSVSSFFVGKNCNDIN